MTGNPTTTAIPRVDGSKPSHRTNRRLGQNHRTRDNLQEVLRETRQIKQTAIEEEVFTGMANIEKTCNNALRQFGESEKPLE